MMPNNPFGGTVFGQMWEAVNDETEERAKECLMIMKGVINKKTGALSDAVELEKIKDGEYLVGVNENVLVADSRNIGHVNYVAYYYYGSRPHIIRAKKGNTLHWVKNGVNYYAKFVRHPGNKPHNFIQETLDKMR